VLAERMVVVGSRLGLHARPAAVFSQAAADSGVEVTLATADGRMVDAASILSVLGLGIGHGDVVLLTAEGPTAEDTLDTLAVILRTDLDGAAQQSAATSEGASHD
jgi:phosphocarrier protein HPr